MRGREESGQDRAPSDPPKEEEKGGRAREGKREPGKMSLGILERVPGDSSWLGSQVG